MASVTSARELEESLLSRAHASAKALELQRTKEHYN